MKKLTKLGLGILLFVLSMSMVSAVCTVTFDKDSYFAGETVTAAMKCNEATERSKAYSLLWGNQSGGNLLETDSGTTPAADNILFYQSYILGTDVGNFTINATLTGTNLEGFDSATVSSASANALIISNASFGGGFIGKAASIQATVKDANGKKISGGQCYISGLTNDETTVVLDYKTQMLNGRIGASAIISADRFAENTAYSYTIDCFCGSDGGAYECIDEDGTAIADYIGSFKGSFITKQWLTVNTVVDIKVPELKQQIFICANVTNINYTNRVPMEIYHQLRCSSDIDNDADLDRVIVASDDSTPDERGISVGSTQMQCKTFIIPEARHLQGRSSECYASTNVWVVDENKNIIIGYVTTSPVFNISGGELQIDADWEFKSHSVIGTIVNLSSSIYSYYNGTGIGNIDIRVAKPTMESLKHEDQYDIKSLYIADLIDALNIHNITVNNGTELQRGVNYQLEYLNDGYLEIEIRDVDISSSGWYNVTLEFDNFPERQTVALENQSTALQTIANNTGTFYFSISMEDNIYGSPSVYTVTTIREFGVGDIEGTFECYIDGYKEETKDRWAQSIKYPEGITNTRILSMPDAAPQGQAYTLICKVGTAGLGNTITTAYKTFVFNPPVDVGSPGTAAPIGPGDIIGKTTEFAEKLKRPLSEQLAKNPLLIILGASLLIHLYLRRRYEGEENG